MVSLVIVSHSAKVAEGVKEISAEMAGEELIIVAAGGMSDGAIGTDAVRISEAIWEADCGDGVVVLADLGSAILSTDMALELLGADWRARVRIADAPIVEGAIGAAISASTGSPIDEVVEGAESSRDLRKLKGKDNAVI